MMWSARIQAGPRRRVSRQRHILTPSALVQCHDQAFVRCCCPQATGGGPGSLRRRTASIPSWRRRASNLAPAYTPTPTSRVSPPPCGSTSTSSPPCGPAEALAVGYRIPAVGERGVHGRWDPCVRCHGIEMPAARPTPRCDFALRPGLLRHDAALGSGCYCMGGWLYAQHCQAG